MPDFLCVVPIREQTLVRSKSSVPSRRPRTWSLVHCMFHDPRQRGVPSPTTAFRRRTISRRSQRRLHHWRLWQRRLRQWSLHHPLGKHRSPNNLLLFEVVQHYLYIIANGRRGARAGDINCILDRLFTVAHRCKIAGRRGARIDGELFRRINDLISSD